jgi:type I restriction enzyme R subunit
VQESYEDRQTGTAEALAQLMKEIEANERRKKEQAAKGFDGVTYFVYSILRGADIPNAEIISKRIRTAFVEHPNWATSERELREVRQKITFAIFPEEDNFEKVAAVVDQLINLLQKAQGTPS